MKNSDKPAFIQCEDSQMKRSNLDPDINYGLTKREYFAGLAMQGLLANNHPLSMDLSLTDWQKMVAKNSVLFADELLKQLGEKP